MRYTVAWSVDAQNDLLEIWMASRQRAAVTSAAAAIDKALANDPGTKGDDFYGDRLLIIEPLGAIFSVSNDDRIASVLRVYTY